MAEEYHAQPFFGHVPHYYGDHVRQLFIVAAALMLIAAPFYTDALRVQLPFIIIGALVLAAIAALANPLKQSVFIAGAIASGVGLVVYESWALFMYSESSWPEFVLREGIAIVFLIAFYFNMKTVRAFVLHRIGKYGEAGEFDTSSVPRASSGQKKTESSKPDDFLPWASRSGGGSKKVSDSKTDPAATADTGPRMTPGRSREEIMPKTHPYEEQL
jgi:hypothetical protein